VSEFLLDEADFIVAIGKYRVGDRMFREIAQNNLWDVCIKLAF